MLRLNIPEKTTPVLLMSGAIFIVLLAANGIFKGISNNKVDAQQHYEKLALALQAEGVLPFQRDDAFLMLLASVALHREDIRDRATGSFMSSTISLGDVLKGYTDKSDVVQIEINPQEFRLLRPGNLRNALREFAGRHQNQLLPRINGQPASLSQPVEFFVTPANTIYRIMPVFSANRCVKLVITE